MIDPKTIEQSIELSKEVVGAYRETVEAASGFGKFMGPFLKAPLTQISGFVEEAVWRWRQEAGITFEMRTREKMEQLGITTPNRPLPLNLAYPLFDSATKTDDKLLQDLWANLLINSTRSESGIDLQRFYIELLDQISAEEAEILQSIYSLPFEVSQKSGVLSSGLPKTPQIARPEQDPLAAYQGLPSEKKAAETQPSENIKLSLANLDRIGCITLPQTWGGNQIFTRVNPTHLGYSFVRACTLQAP